jgi:hypothetical protein
MGFIDPEDEQKILQDWGYPPDRREINLDTHIGAAPQKPFARLEPLLARKRTGWRSFEEMHAAVEAAYPEGSDGRKLEQNENGEAFRWVKGHTGERVASADGTLLLRAYEERVPVAFNQQDARAASTSGVRTDYFNGWTWMKGGIKAERDVATMAAAPDANPNRKVFYEPADEAEQMRHRAAVAATASNLGLTPMPPPAADTAPTAKPAAKSGKGD